MPTAPMAFKLQQSMCSNVTLNWHRVDTGIYTFPSCPSMNEWLASEAAQTAWTIKLMCWVLTHQNTSEIFLSTACSYHVHAPCFCILYPVGSDHFQPAQTSFWIRLHLKGALRRVKMLPWAALHAATNPTSALCHTPDSASFTESLLFFTFSCSDIDAPHEMYRLLYSLNCSMSLAWLTVNSSDRHQKGSFYAHTGWCCWSFMGALTTCSANGLFSSQSSWLWRRGPHILAGATGYMVGCHAGISKLWTFLEDLMCALPPSNSYLVCEIQIQNGKYKTFKYKCHVIF